MATKVVVWIYVIIMIVVVSDANNLGESTKAINTVNCAVIVRRCQGSCGRGSEDHFVRWKIDIVRSTIHCSKENVTSVSSLNVGPNPLIVVFDVKCCQKSNNNNSLMGKQLEQVIRKTRNECELKRLQEQQEHLNFIKSYLVKTCNKNVDRPFIKDDDKNVDRPFIKNGDKNVDRLFTMALAIAIGVALALIIGVFSCVLIILNTTCRKRSNFRIMDINEKSSHPGMSSSTATSSVGSQRDRERNQPGPAANDDDVGECMKTAAENVAIHPAKQRSATAQFAPAQHNDSCSSAFSPVNLASDSEKRAVDVSNHSAFPMIALDKSNAVKDVVNQHEHSEPPDAARSPSRSSHFYVNSFDNEWNAGDAPPSDDFTPNAMNVLSNVDATERGSGPADKPPPYVQPPYVQIPIPKIFQHELPGKSHPSDAEMPSENPVNKSITETASLESTEICSTSEPSGHPGTNVNSGYVDAPLVFVVNDSSGAKKLNNHGDGAKPKFDENSIEEKPIKSKRQRAEIPSRYQYNMLLPTGGMHDIGEYSTLDHAPARITTAFT